MPAPESNRDRLIRLDRAYSRLAVERDRYREALEEIVGTEYCADCERHAYQIATKALTAIAPQEPES